MRDNRDEDIDKWIGVETSATEGTGKSNNPKQAQQFSTLPPKTKDVGGFEIGTFRSCGSC